jgi:hypothetical protein
VVSPAGTGFEAWCCEFRSILYSSFALPPFHSSLSLPLPLNTLFYFFRWALYSFSSCPTLCACSGEYYGHTWQPALRI